MEEQLKFDVGSIEKHHTIGVYILRKMNIWDMLFIMFGIRRKYIHTFCMARPNYLAARNRCWLM